MIRIASDIHSEFFQLEDIPAMALQALPKMEDDKETMLVLAGDIGSMHKPANLGSFIDEVAPRFKTVYYTSGNHECLDSETECLTKRGWIKYDQIEKTDEILSMDIVTEKCEWDKIDEIIIKQSDHILTMNTGNFKMSVTSGHRVLNKKRLWDKKGWSSLQYTLASEMKKTDYSIPVSSESARLEYDISDNMLKLLSWIVTDGHINKWGHISISQSKPSDIKDLLDILGVSYLLKVRDRDIKEICGRKLLKRPLPNIEYHIHAKDSQKIMKMLPQGRTIPDWMFTDLSSRQSRLFILGMMDGNGGWKDTGTSGALHGEKEILERAQILCAQSGISSGFGVTTRGHFVLNICTERKYLQLGNNGRFIKESYSGDVWCLKTKKLNFMVRKNGRSFFTGNCYGGNIQSTPDVIAILIKPHKNVTFSNCGSFDNIHMTTLWTDFEGGNPVSMNEAAAYMNDYRLINNGKRRNSPTDILQMHTAMRQHLETFVKEGDIVITHHAPSFQSVPEEYKHERINGAYASDLEDLILRKKPAVWFHGHMHTAKDYMIGNTRIIINPRGYGNQHKSNGYNPRLVIEV